MSLIDQRILIVAPAEAIWSTLTPPAMLTRWHQGSKQVSILSTRPTGVGARRRIVGPDGRATVEETTAWLENIGYEYVVIDGPYKTFKGRFRLQAVPEGTIVNWTVEYQLKGAFSGLRNLLNHQRKLEDQMVGSLRQLKKTVESSGAKIDPEKHSKAAMQAAPSVEVRAARRPAPELTQVSGQPVGLPVTPPYPTKPIILDEDDLPVPVTSSEVGALTVPSIPRAPSDPPMPAIAPEPTLISVASTPQAQSAQNASLITDSDEDTKPRPPAGLREAISAQPPTPIEPMEEVSDPGALTVPISLVAPPRPPDPDTQTIEVPAVSASEAEIIPGIPSALPEHIPTDPLLLFKPTEDDKTPPRGIQIIEPDISSLEDTHPTSPVIVPPEIAEPTPATPPASVSHYEEVIEVPVDPNLPPPTGKRDTGEVSIWDRFGVQRPSERTKAELEAVMASITPSPIPAVEIPLAVPKVVRRRAIARKASPSVRAKAQKPPRHKRHIPVRRR